MEVTRTEKLNIATLIVVGIACVGVLTHSAFNQPKVRTLEDDDTLISNIESRRCFDTHKEAPKLADILERYDCSDTLLLDTIWAAMYADYASKYADGQTHESFGNYIHQYYTSHNDTTINPWLLWYENTKCNQ